MASTRSPNDCRSTFPLIVRARLGRTLLSRLDAAVTASGAAPAGYDPQEMREIFYRFFGPEDVEPTDPIAAARDRTAPRAVRARHALRGRSVDGVRVYQFTRPDLTVAMFPGEFAGALPPSLLTVVSRCAARVPRCGSRTPTSSRARARGRSRWEGDQLEYAVSGMVSRGTTTTTVDAAEHQGGHLDWYSFDQGATRPAAGDEASAMTVDVRTVIPAPAEYPGMPKPRWWQFEDAAVDLGKLSADATDAARIVVSEFALLYSNDWFTIICRQPVGSVAELQGVIVTDTFGWRTLVKPTVEPAGSDWTGWDAFSLSPRPVGRRAGADAAAPVHASHAAADQRRRTAGAGRVRARRDRRHGVGDRAAHPRRARRVAGCRRGVASHAAAARPDRRCRARSGDAGRRHGGVPLRYTLQTEVAENWIPFIPVHIDGQLRAIQLQRGTMRRTIGPEDTLIRPVTSILRERHRRRTTTASRRTTCTRRKCPGRGSRCRDSCAAPARTTGRRSSGTRGGSRRAAARRGPGSRSTASPDGRRWMPASACLLVRSDRREGP